MSRIFGTDGVRGLANGELLTPELALGLGRALVEVLIEEGHDRPTVVIGRDSRISGDMLGAALGAGITSAGGNVLDVGIVPTPAVAFLVPDLSAHAGAMISASHNPVQDNGIKFIGGDGYKLSDAEEDRIQELLDAGVSTSGEIPRPTGLALGRYAHDGRASSRWLESVVRSIDDDSKRGLRGLKIVVDGANGAASILGPQIYRALGVEVIDVHCKPNGTNINDGCGSTHPEVVSAAVVEHGADLGIAHDGDADRLICADADGNEVDGDVILAILAQDAHERGQLTGDTVVTTVMTNLGFKRAMSGLGIEVVETKVGDRYVLEAMRAGGFVLGGEQSGHVIQLDRATTGDGVLTAVRLLEVVGRSGRPLSELAGVMSRLPQVLVNVPEVRKDDLDGCEPVWNAVREQESVLGDGGRVLVRKSGTEPLVRVMVEAETEDQAQSSADAIAAVVAEALAR